MALFVSVSGAFTVGIPEDRVRLALESAEQRDRITDPERLAYGLYSLSRTVWDRLDARFIVLMMAFEALVGTQGRTDSPRPAETHDRGCSVAGVTSFRVTGPDTVEVYEGTPESRLRRMAATGWG